MLMAASDLLARNRSPSPAEVMDALGGVLCRCTGYRKIVAAVLDVADPRDEPSPPVGGAVGARLGKVDGPPKLTGRERYGADGIPGAALWLKVIRSPHARATFTLGDPAPLLARHPGVLRVLTAADVPVNGFGIYPHLKDQPVLADGVVRYRGEAVAALLGERAALEAVRGDELPVRYRPLPAVTGLDAATATGAPLVQADRPGNLLIEGAVRSGDGEAALAGCAALAEGEFTTAFVEHAYIEPEAGWAQRVGERIEVHVTTQSPYLDRDETARVLGIAPERVRDPADRLRRRLRRQARPLGAAAAGGRGIAGRPPGRPGLRAAREHGELDQAPSGADPGAPRLRPGGPAPSLHRERRFRHRRLRLLGTDGRRARSGPCHRPLSRAARRRLRPRDLHQRSAVRRLSRLRRAPGRDRARGADGRPGAPPRHRPAPVPPAQRAARGGSHRDRSAARGERRHGGLPGGPRAALAGTAWHRRRVQPQLEETAARHWHRLHVVRHRQHRPAPSLDHPAGADPRRPPDPLQRRARHRPGRQHHPQPDRGRRARRAGGSASTS